MTVAEISRISEDWGRFQLPMRVSHRPLLGWMKGSWNIINGAVENNVTWDTNCAAEDFWFAFNVSQQFEQRHLRTFCFMLLMSSLS